MSVCKNCGWMYSGKYCPKCGTEYISDNDVVDFSEVTLYSENDEDKEAKARRNLWDAMHVSPVDVAKCFTRARELKTFAPKDYYADFTETALQGKEKTVCDFLNKSADCDVRMYGDAVMDYLCGHMNTKLYCAVVDYMRRPFDNKDTKKYIAAVSGYIPDKVIRERVRKENEEKRREKRALREYELDKRKESVQQLKNDDYREYGRCVRAQTGKTVFSCVSACLFLAMLVTLFVGLLHIAEVDDIPVYVVLSSVAALIFAVVLGVHISELIGLKRHGIKDLDGPSSGARVGVFIAIDVVCALCSLVFWVLGFTRSPGRFPYVAFVVLFFISLAVLIYGIVVSVSVGKVRGFLYWRGYLTYNARKSGKQRETPDKAVLKRYVDSGRVKNRSSVGAVLYKIFASRFLYVVLLSIVVVAAVMFFTIRSTSAIYNKNRVVGGYISGRDNGYIEELLGCSADVYSDRLGEPTLETDTARYWYDDDESETYEFVMVTFEGKDKSVTSVFFDKNHVYDETDDFSSTEKEVSRVSFSKDSVRLKYLKTTGSNIVYELYDTLAYAVEYKDGSYYATYVSDYTLTTTSLSTCVVEWSDRLGSYSSSVPLVSNYVVDEEGVLTYVYTTDGVIDVPKDVTSVADDALAGVTYINKINLPSTVKSVVIPETVNTIEEGAFSGCTSLESITLNGGTTYARMFSKCTSLKMLTIGGAVERIEDSAFHNQTSITNVTIGGSVAYIGQYSFYGCTHLESVTIGDDVTYIGKHSFYGCTHLESLTIGVGVTSIDQHAFYNCTSLTEINFNAVAMDNLESRNYVFGSAGQSGSGITFTVGADVTRIPAYLFFPISTSYNNFKKYSPNITAVFFEEGSHCSEISNNAFYYCDNITGVYITDVGAWCSIDFYSRYSNPLYYAKNLYLNGEIISGDIVIPSSVTSIGNSAFYYCTSITSVTIPNGVTSIDSYAFYYCTSLTDVSIPDSVTYLGYDAFAISKITSVTIPKGVTRIYDWTFYACRSLESVSISDSVTSIGTYAFESCSSLTSVDIPNSVTKIGKSAFYECSSLASVTIGTGVTSIADYAFYGCSSLKTVYYRGSSSAWSKISIGSNNTTLTSAKIYYNSN